MIRSAILLFLAVVCLSGCQKQNTGGGKAATYQVVITSYDKDRKVTAIKAVRDNTGIGLSEAKALVENAPSTLTKGLTEDDARSLAKRLEASGLETKVAKE